MKPQSLAAKLLAATPQGRRMFELLGRLHEEAERLRAELTEARSLPQKQVEFEGQDQEAQQKLAIVEQLLTAQELESASLRLELDLARATVASLSEATRSLTQGLPFLRDLAHRRPDLLTARVAGPAEGQDDHVQSPPLAGQRGGAAVLYLDLLEKALTGGLHDDPTAALHLGASGPARLSHLRRLLETALADGVEGDVFATGAGRGGSGIYARAILAAHGDKSRRVFVADSFRGLPRARDGASPGNFGELDMSQQQVAGNFARYGLLDERVVFLEDAFKDIPPAAPIDKLAMLRLGGEDYESTIQALEALCPRVSPGGFVIIQDDLPGPGAKAVQDYRDRFGISAPPTRIDGAAVWWQVPSQHTVGMG